MAAPRTTSPKAEASDKPVRSEFLIFGSPALEEAEIQEVVATLRSGWIGTGPKVARFEEEFRRYIGAPHAMALNSCTAALHLSMIAAGVGPGDEVVTVPHTFAASANAIVHTGATPVFVDVDVRTQNMDAARLPAAITAKTKAILPVHFAGRPADMDAINDVARRHGLLVIEDAAHATEGVYHGRRVGTLGDAACFSFYVTKNLVTGEGGMVTTSRADWAEKIQTYGLHGLSKGAWKRYSDEGFVHYQVLFPGFKYNMTDLQAALGIHQLARVEANLRRREEIWRRYDEAFAELAFELPPAPAPGARHARHLYTLRVETGRSLASRDRLLAALHAEGIGAGVHYRALFVVGMVLFVIVLGINWTAQRLLHKFRISHD